MFANNFLKGDLLCFVHSFAVLYIVSLEHVKDLKIKKKYANSALHFPTDYTALEHLVSSPAFNSVTL